MDPFSWAIAIPAIREAVIKQLADGWLYGTPTELEVSLAKEIIRLYASIEMVRFVSTGTEATMGALRAARGFTGKNKFIKIEGGFHGAHDAALVKAGSAQQHLVLRTLLAFQRILPGILYRCHLITLRQ